MRVNLGHHDGAVAEQLLDGEEIDSSHGELGGEIVAQVVPSEIGNLRASRRASNAFFGEVRGMPVGVTNTKPLSLAPSGFHAFKVESLPRSSAHVASCPPWLWTLAR